MTLASAAIGRRTKFAYGLGAVAIGVRDTGFNSFILIFYNQVLGLSATLAGLALMLTLFADSLFDPLVGLVSDSWRSRLGRRHPFLYAAAIPAAATYGLLWFAPAGLSEMGLFWWLLAVSVLARACMSVFEVPFVSLVAEVTTDYDQRTSLITWMYVFGWWTGLALSIAAYSIFLRPTLGDPSGMFSRHGFTAFGLTGSVLTVLSILVAAVATQSKVQRLATSPARTLGLSQAFGRMRAVLSDRSVAALMLSVVLLSAGQGFGNALYNYIQVFFWGLNTNQITLLALAPVVSATLALILAPRLAKGREKRDLAVILAVVAVIGQPLPVVLRLLGLFPAGGAPLLVPILVVHSAFETTVWVLFSIISSSMVADLVEDQQRRTGERSEGALFSLRIFAQKTVSGLGVLLTGLVLGFVGFKTGTRPGQTPADVLAHLGLAYAVIQLALGLASAAALRGYGVTRARHTSNLAALAEASAGL